MSKLPKIQRIQHYRRILLAVVLVVVGFCLLFVGSHNSEPVHDMLEALGIGFIIIGILGRMWCTLYIGGKKSQELVDKGPYSISRNPLYLFSSIGAFGVGAQTGTFSVALIACIGCVIAFSIVTKFEEAHLASLFGEAYQAYLQRVPRLLPNPSLFEDAPQLDVSTRRLYATFSDGLVFFVAVPMFELIEHFQNSGLLPVLFRVY